MRFISNFVPCHKPVVIVPNFVKFVEPGHVDNAVFSILLIASVIFVNFFVIVVEKFASLPKLAANSFNVFNAPGALLITFAICVSICERVYKLFNKVLLTLYVVVISPIASTISFNVDEFFEIFPILLINVFVL